MYVEVGVNSMHYCITTCGQVFRHDSVCRTMCRAGWRQYQGSCYRRVGMSATVTWHEAQKACNNHGGHLPTISSADENSFVLNMYRSSCSSSTGGLLGFHDYVKEQHFIWVDDSTSCYTNWKTGEPNNAGANYNEEDCALMYLRGTALSKWNDFFCNQKNTNCFLCEDSKPCVVITIPTLNWTLFCSTIVSTWMDTVWR